MLPGCSDLLEPNFIVLEQIFFLLQISSISPMGDVLQSGLAKA